MDIQTLTEFFMWCTILNGGLLVYWVAWCFFAPNFVYRMQTKWFPIPRETYDVVIYGFLGLFKIVFIVFCAVPYLTLVIMG